MSAVETRLGEAGLHLPDVAAPVASYIPAIRSGQHVFTSGQLPMSGGSLIHTGKVGAEVTPDQAVECARQCALNALAAVKSVIGSLDDIAQVVKATVFVASSPDFTGQPAVANGASDLFAVAFGDAGRHSRSAVGVAVLPLDAPVEVELIVEVS